MKPIKKIELKVSDNADLASIIFHLVKSEKLKRCIFIDPSLTERIKKQYAHYKFLLWSNADILNEFELSENMDVIPWMCVTLSSTNLDKRYGNFDDFRDQKDEVYFIS